MICKQLCSQVLQEDRFHSFCRKTLAQFVKKSEIYPSIAPDHKAIYISLSLSNETPRGRGLWKFNNSLLNNEHYVNKIREIYFQTCSYYSELTDKRLFWEMLKVHLTPKLFFGRDETVQHSHREFDNFISIWYF